MTIIIPANSAADTAYSITNSCRFDGSNDYLTITFSGSPTSNQKGTVSYWTKRSGLGASMFSGLVAVETALDIFELLAASNRQELAISYVVAAVADATFPGKIKGIKPPTLADHLMVLHHYYFLYIKFLKLEYLMR